MSVMATLVVVVLSAVMCLGCVVSLIVIAGAQNRTPANRKDRTPGNGVSAS